jgi:hypothetical protein
VAPAEVSGGVAGALSAYGREIAGTTENDAGKQTMIRGMMRAGLLVALAALGGCLTPVEQGTPMTPKEITTDLVGKSWVGKMSNGSETTQTVNADGTIQISGGLNDRGRWRMSDNGYCATWNRMRHGAEGCYTIDRTPSGHYVIRRADGSVLMTVTHVT